MDDLEAVVAGEEGVAVGQDVEVSSSDKGDLKKIMQTCTILDFY